MRIGLSLVLALFVLHGMTLQMNASVNHVTVKTTSLFEFRF